jgi:hypothetical protein
MSDVNDSVLCALLRQRVESRDECFYTLIVDPPTCELIMCFYLQQGFVYQLYTVW